jgi:hypothetical protein
MYTRKAQRTDCPVLMEIFHKARQIMRASGNLDQWNDSYPSQDIILNDIDNGYCVLLCEHSETDGAETIIASMSFIPGPDPTYSYIEKGPWDTTQSPTNGSWIDDRPYYVIHRIAVAEPEHNAAKTLLDWGFAYIKENDAAHSIRIDTHRDNVIMHHILRKYGFDLCGVIYLASGAPRDAYQKRNDNQ